MTCIFRRQMLAGTPETLWQQWRRDGDSVVSTGGDNEDGDDCDDRWVDMVSIGWCCVGLCVVVTVWWCVGLCVVATVWWCVGLCVVATVWWCVFMYSDSSMVMCVFVYRENCVFSLVKALLVYDNTFFFLSTILFVIHIFMTFLLLFLCQQCFPYKSDFYYKITAYISLSIRFYSCAYFIPINTGKHKPHIWWARNIHKR